MVVEMHNKLNPKKTGGGGGGFKAPPSTFRAITLQRAIALAATLYDFYI